MTKSRDYQRKQSEARKRFGTERLCTRCFTPRRHVCGESLDDDDQRTMDAAFDALIACVATASVESISTASAAFAKLRDDAMLIDRIPAPEALALIDHVSDALASTGDDDATCD